MSQKINQDQQKYNSEISEAEIDAGTASTLRTVTGRRAKYVYDKAVSLVQGLTNWITTAMLKDHSVTADKIDWETIGGGHYEVGVEKPTGATFNNKPVYRKVISVPALPNNALNTYRYAPAGTVDIPLACGGSALRTANGTHGAFPLPFVSFDLPFQIFMLMLRDEIQIRTGSDRTNLSATVWVEYTKL